MTSIPINEGDPSEASKAAIEEVRRVGIIALSKRQMPCPVAVAAHIEKCLSENREKAIDAIIELMRAIGYTEAANAFEKTQVTYADSWYIRIWKRLRCC